ncbi:hypothetical protein BN1058_02186 [Paraliobacillus sp. PM-2]|uniref:hypothetical protein n=1 Tax=Paraliobacillus sp. PM-2 TaxID=1462524 RepID=UPI00061C8F21|nr:hypothetical protein [Paraliobacillus sp. PM-2]CQR47855.1 hypothetical protein BN1058_02186 [Paraliobacillus sp. PM-2]
MKKILYHLILINLIVIFTGCSSNEKPVIVQEEMNGTEQESAKLIEESNEKDSEEPQMMIEFMLEEEQLTINLDKIPILKNYLSQIENRKDAIDQMKINKLDIESTESIYLLGFAGSENMYSYLLLDPTDAGRSFLLTDRAKFLKISQSPDNKKLLFYFERTVKNQPWKTNKIVVLDLLNWESNKLINNADHNNIALNQFKWPILNIKWTDNESVSTTVPSIKHATKDELTKWINSEQSTKQVEFFIANE